ncbi:hypothetical protein PSTT_08595, partial [Puccinia striiformis]
MIADSVETMAFQLYNPAQTNTHTEDGYFTQAVKLLPNCTNFCSRRCKAISNFAKDIIDVFMVSNFAKDIIDVFMGYIIFQAHTHTPKPLGNTNLKRKS